MELLISQEVLIRFAAILFVLSAVVQMAYLLLVHGRLAFFKGKNDELKESPVSIVIAARNEEENLLSNLPIILEQDYPEFEVIVINDASYDNTIDILNGYREKYSNLRVINVHENDHFEGGKKFAVTLGVKGAKYERLVFTDADCRPNSRRWISGLMKNRKSDESIILGYSPYRREKGFLNRLIRFDAWMTAMNYMGLSLCGLPYMGVGRNLSYTRSAFFAVGGFKSHYTLKSGDDDLLINQIANSRNTAICVDKDSIVESLPEKDWKSYWRQKRRHLTTGHRYKKLHKFILLLQPLSLLCFWITAVSLLVAGVWFELVLATVIIRVLAQIFIFNRSSQWLGQADLVILAPILEIILILISASVHIANSTSKSVSWKT